jgi:uncharacterized protein (DUF1501 family)
MATSRRGFLKGCCAAVSGAIASPALVPSFSFAQGAPSDLLNVVDIFLPGGPDARYLFPYLSGAVDAALRARRPTISLAAESIITPTGFDQNGRLNPIGFHPNFASLVNKVNQTGAGIALITEFGATANASRSHEVAQQMYRDASLASQSQVPAGWIGRTVAEFGLPGLSVWGFGLGDPKFMAVDGPDKPFVVSNLGSVSFNNRDFSQMNCSGLVGNPCGNPNRSATAQEDSIYMRDVLRRLQDASGSQSNSLQQLLADSQRAVFDAVPVAARMISEVTIDLNLFGGNLPLANSCRDIARAIYYLNLSPQAPANIKAGTKIFATARGGWDSHSNQAAGGNVPANITQLASAIAGLVHYLDEWNLLDKTIISAHGEFGRTCAQNGSAGTDHAEAGHFLVVGGAAVVRRGVFGPEASVDQAQNANFFTAQVPQTGILRAILSKAFDPEGLDRVFANPMPGSVPNFLV